MKPCSDLTPVPAKCQHHNTRQDNLRASKAFQHVATYYINLIEAMWLWTAINWNPQGHVQTLCDQTWRNSSRIASFTPQKWPGKTLKPWEPQDWSSLERSAATNQYESWSSLVSSRHVSSCLVIWLLCAHLHDFVTEMDILSAFMCHLLSLPLIANLTKTEIPNRLVSDIQGPPLCP